MNPVVKEWTDKAEGDFRTANREFRAQPDPNFDATCYHAQQCIEKLMKAILIAKGVTPPQTHNLIGLDEVLRKAQPMWSWQLADLRALSLAAVHFRYPGASATEEDADHALAVCRDVRKKLLELLRDA